MYNTIFFLKQMLIILKQSTKHANWGRRCSTCTSAALSYVAKLKKTYRGYYKSFLQCKVYSINSNVLVKRRSSVHSNVRFFCFSLFLSRVFVFVCLFLIMQPLLPNASVSRTVSQLLTGGYSVQKTLWGCAANMGSKISLLVFE